MVIQYLALGSCRFNNYLYRPRLFINQESIQDELSITSPHLFAMESSSKIYNYNRSISDITNHAYQHKRSRYG
ncbi:hypothetical protein L211DRAFT_835823 [Terfezia boudieri ATCC MYA-4762]|uniref:Uncharacterized protein n=1 Tax=Terfezia boudieri ATCC MYA-4762 TaxID=1051890 RepID=A0A3N4LS87_9PEZI|nr:hypothetical protein L211DRAFT_835823 [Terfezia boudieri ATCC MYA-4762]